MPLLPFRCLYKLTHCPTIPDNGLSLSGDGGQWVACNGTLTHWPLDMSYGIIYLRSMLVQPMACCLFGTKPFPEPMLVYCQLNLWLQPLSKTLSKIPEFKLYKIYLKMLFAKYQPFCSSLVVLLAEPTMDKVVIHVLTHWGSDKMARILQMIFSNAFSSKKLLTFLFKFPWFTLTINQHWFR